MTERLLKDKFVAPSLENTVSQMDIDDMRRVLDAIHDRLDRLEAGGVSPTEELPLADPPVQLGIIVDFLANCESGFIDIDELRECMIQHGITTEERSDEMLEDSLWESHLAIESELADRGILMLMAEHEGRLVMGERVGAEVQNTKITAGEKVGQDPELEEVVVTGKPDVKTTGVPASTLLISCELLVKQTNSCELRLDALLNELREFEDFNKFSDQDLVTALDSLGRAGKLRLVDNRGTLWVRLAEEKAATVKPVHSPAESKASPEGQEAIEQEIIDKACSVMLIYLTQSMPRSLMSSSEIIKEIYGPPAAQMSENEKKPYREAINTLSTLGILEAMKFKNPRVKKAKPVTKYRPSVKVMEDFDGAEIDKSTIRAILNKAISSKA